MLDDPSCVRGSFAIGKKGGKKEGRKEGKKEGVHTVRLCDR